MRGRLMSGFHCTCQSSPVFRTCKSTGCSRNSEITGLRKNDVVHAEAHLEVALVVAHAVVEHDLEHKGEAGKKNNVILESQPKYILVGTNGIKVLVLALELFFLNQLFNKVMRYDQSIKTDMMRSYCVLYHRVNFFFNIRPNK